MTTSSISDILGQSRVAEDYVHISRVSFNTLQPRHDNQLSTLIIARLASLRHGRCRTNEPNVFYLQITSSKTGFKIYKIKQVFLNAERVPVFISRALLVCLIYMEEMFKKPYRKANLNL